MKTLAIAAVLAIVAGQADARAAGFDSPSYGDGCRGSCPTYYADADPTIGSGDTQYDFWGLVYSNSPSLRHWAMRNRPLINPNAKVHSLRPMSRPTMCGGCTAPDTYDYNRNFLPQVVGPIREGAPAPRLPCGDEILAWFPGLDVSDPPLYQWMKAQPCGI